MSALELCVDVSLLSHWTSRSKPVCMPLHRLVRWTKVMGPGLLRWIARKCGFELVELAPNGNVPDPSSLVAIFSRKAGAAVGQTIEDIASGGTWDPEERRADLRTWLQVQSIVDGIVNGIQDSLKEHAV
ncbi:hypothetical protein [Mesoterricola sediminis]|uniref:hypothetical protein n=1 Tax=Mesoterricola sediminis TaxID=2927980 RepID=UPI002930E402|nr:hypothetical protein [Mesoterricola sediminis]